MQSNLVRYDENFLHFFFDFETCAVNLISPNNLVWEMGMIVCKGTEILKQIKHYVRWEPLPMTKGAAVVNKFNFKEREYWETAINPKVALDEFESYLYDPKYTIMGHNILGFDIYLHNIWRRKLGRKSDWSYLKRVIDTDTLARGAKNQYLYTPGDDLLAYQYRAGSIIKKDCKTNLTTLGKENKIEYDYDNLHDALNDVILNKKIWDTYLKWRLET